MKCKYCLEEAQLRYSAYNVYYPPLEIGKLVERHDYSVEMYECPKGHRFTIEKK